MTHDHAHCSEVQRSKHNKAMYAIYKQDKRRLAPRALHAALRCMAYTHFGTWYLDCRGSTHSRVAVILHGTGIVLGCWMSRPIYSHNWDNNYYQTSSVEEAFYLLCIHIFIPGILDTFFSPNVTHSDKRGTKSLGRSPDNCRKLHQGVTSSMYCFWFFH